MRIKLGFIILLAAYVLLVPGLTSPMITLTGTVDKADMVELGKELITDHPDLPGFLRKAAAELLDRAHVEGSIPAYEKTRSILGTVQELADSKNYLVAFLITLFSVVVPIGKGALLINGLVQRDSPIADTGAGIGHAISKWSMADVFVVAIIVAYLAANATQRTDEIFTLNARFEPGFYFFLSYCLLSILSAQLLAASRQPGRQSADATDRPDPKA
jgi:hypothetical protein